MQTEQDTPTTEATAMDTTPPKFTTVPRAPDLQFGTMEQQQFGNHSSMLYWDRSHYPSPEAQVVALSKSSTVYIGNLAFSTRSIHLRSHFTTIGPVKQIIMGMDRVHKERPCGFAFCEYMKRKDALAAVQYLSGTKLDGRIIRVELDAGFQPGRQYGRGKQGGQVRDDPHKRHSHGNDTGRKRSNIESMDTSTDDAYYGPAGGALDTKRRRTSL